MSEQHFDPNRISNPWLRDFCDQMPGGYFIYKADEKEELSELKVLLGDFASAMSSDNITMAAIKAYFKEKSGKVPVSKTGFSSVTKYSSVTFKDGAYVLGAPEFVLKEKYPGISKENFNNICFYIIYKE